MSSIGKSEKFRQNENFSSLLQPSTSEVFRKDYHLKGKWNKEVFKNDNPITLELGCGKGEYTIALAQMYPQRNFIGVDIKGARLWKGAKYAEEHNLANVKFIRTSIDFIEWIFDKDEVSEIWITFADPQLKSARKRLTSTLFLNRYRMFLKPDARINLKTDSIFLHTYTKESCKQNGCRIFASSEDIYNATEEEQLSFPKELLSVQTFYEKFFLEMGLHITFLSFALPPVEKQLVEPEWDVEFWKRAEDVGRIKKSIR